MTAASWRFRSVCEEDLDKVFLWFYVINMPQCPNEIDIDKDIPSSRRNAI